MSVICSLFYILESLVARLLISCCAMVIWYTLMHGNDPYAWITWYMKTDIKKRKAWGGFSPRQFCYRYSRNSLHVKTQMHIIRCQSSANQSNLISAKYCVHKTLFTSSGKSTSVVVVCEDIHKVKPPYKGIFNGTHFQLIYCLFNGRFISSVLFLYVWINISDCLMICYIDPEEKEKTGINVVSPSL